MEEGVTIVWNDLSVYAKTQRKGVLKHTRIINGGTCFLYNRLTLDGNHFVAVSGAVKAGTLVALMGSRWDFFKLRIADLNSLVGY